MAHYQTVRAVPVKLPLKLWGGDVCVDFYLGPESHLRRPPPPEGQDPILFLLSKDRAARGFIHFRGEDPARYYAVVVIVESEREDYWAKHKDPAVSWLVLDDTGAPGFLYCVVSQGAIC